MRKHAIQSTLYIGTYFYVHPWSTQALQCPARLDRSTAPTCARPPAHARTHSHVLAMLYPDAASHAPLPPRLQEIVDHQRLGVPFRSSRSLMSMCAARENTQAMSAMAINNRGIEAFAWVWCGGACLMAGAGHVACRWPDRPTGGPSSSSCARSGAAVAPARHGLRDRLSEPVQIMRRPDSCLCVRCGRGKPEQWG